MSLLVNSDGNHFLRLRNNVVDLNECTSLKKTKKKIKTIYTSKRPAHLQDFPKIGRMIALEILA